MSCFRWTTYAPKATYITNKNRGLILDQSYISIFNLTTTFVKPPVSLGAVLEFVTIESWSTTLQGALLDGDSWLELIGNTTSITGRVKRPLPPWSQTGAVVGLEGGTTNVTREVQQLVDAGVPVSGEFTSLFLLYLCFKYIFACNQVNGVMPIVSFVIVYRSITHSWRYSVL